MRRADVNGCYGVAVGERDVERVAVGRDRKRAWMRAGLEGIGGFEERQLAGDGVFYEIEFNHLAGIPKSNVSAGAVLRDGDCDWIAAGDGIGFGEIEAMEDAAGCGVDEECVVREVVGDEKTLILSWKVLAYIPTNLSRLGDHRDGGREGDALVAGGAFGEGGAACAGELLQADVDETLRRDAARTEAIDGDFVAGVGIGHGIE